MKNFLKKITKLHLIMIASVIIMLLIVFYNNDTVLFYKSLLVLQLIAYAVITAISIIKFRRYLKKIILATILSVIIMVLIVDSKFYLFSNSSETKFTENIDWDFYNNFDEGYNSTRSVNDIDGDDYYLHPNKYFDIDFDFEHEGERIDEYYEINSNYYTININRPDGKMFVKYNSNGQIIRKIGYDTDVITTNNPEIRYVDASTRDIFVTDGIYDNKIEMIKINPDNDFSKFISIDLSEEYDVLEMDYRTFVFTKTEEGYTINFIASKNNLDKYLFVLTYDLDGNYIDHYTYQSTSKIYDLQPLNFNVEESKITLISEVISSKKSYAVVEVIEDGVAINYPIYFPADYNYIEEILDKFTYNKNGDWFEINASGYIREYDLVEKSTLYALNVIVVQTFMFSLLIFSALYSVDFSKVKKYIDTLKVKNIVAILMLLLLYYLKVIFIGYSKLMYLDAIIFLLIVFLTYNAIKGLKKTKPMSICCLTGIIFLIVVYISPSSFMKYDINTGEEVLPISVIRDFDIGKNGNIEEEVLVSDPLELINEDVVDGDVFRFMEKNGLDEFYTIYNDDNIIVNDKYNTNDLELYNEKQTLLSQSYRDDKLYVLSQIDLTLHLSTHDEDGKLLEIYETEDITSYNAFFPLFNQSRDYMYLLNQDSSGCSLYQFNDGEQFEKLNDFEDSRCYAFAVFDDNILMISTSIEENKLYFKNLDLEGNVIEDFNYRFPYSNYTSHLVNFDINKDGNIYIIRYVSVKDKFNFAESNGRGMNKYNYSATNAAIDIYNSSFDRVDSIYYYRNGIENYRTIFQIVETTNGYDVYSSRGMISLSLESKNRIGALIVIYTMALIYTICFYMIYSLSKLIYLKYLLLSSEDKS